MSYNFFYFRAWNCLRACACMCQVCLADQTRCQYHLPPPHSLSSDTKQYLLIMSGLICKVSSGTTVAWQRWTAAMFCVYLRKMCVCVLVCICVSRWVPQPVSGLLLWSDVKMVSSSASSSQTDKHTHLWQAQADMLSAGSIWKCSQMANWHQQQDKRLKRVVSQDDSAASQLITGFLSFRIQVMLV